MDPKQVIVIRKDLNMRKGKMIAQGAHASQKCYLDMMDLMVVEEDFNQFIRATLYIKKDSMMDKWLFGIFKKIVVGAESLAQLTEVYQAAKKAGMPCALIEDKGLTEFGGEITITACAIGPDDPNEIDKITGHLKLL